MLSIGYGLDVRAIAFRFPRGVRDLFPLHSVQIGSGADRASYSEFTGTLPGEKRLEREADNSPPSIAGVQMCGEIGYCNCSIFSYAVHKENLPFRFCHRRKGGGGVGECFSDNFLPKRNCFDYCVEKGRMKNINTF